jgi:hypothetical protein
VKSGDEALSSVRRALSPSLKHTITGWSKIAWDSKLYQHTETAMHSHRTFGLFWVKHPPGSFRGGSSGCQKIGLMLRAGARCHVRYHMTLLRTPSAEGEHDARWSSDSLDGDDDDASSSSSSSTVWTPIIGYGIDLDLATLTAAGAYSPTDDSITFVIRFTARDTAAPPASCSIQ